MCTGDLGKRLTGLEFGYDLFDFGAGAHQDRIEFAFAVVALFFVQTPDLFFGYGGLRGEEARSIEYEDSRIHILPYFAIDCPQCIQPFFRCIGEE